MLFDGDTLELVSDVVTVDGVLSVQNVSEDSQFEGVEVVIAQCVKNNAKRSQLEPGDVEEEEDEEHDALERRAEDEERGKKLLTGLEYIWVSDCWQYENESQSRVKKEAEKVDLPQFGN